MTINIVLAGKGGVGKSMVASCLAQYFITLNRAAYCANVNPLSLGFNYCDDFDVDQINILNKHSDFEMRKFDRLVEKLIEHSGDSVIDTGGATYLAILGYFERNEVIALLKAHGKRIIIHAPMAGGSGLEPSFRGLRTLLQLGVSVVVWKNEYYGSIVENGRPLEQSEIFCAAGDQIIGVVDLFPADPDTHGKDILLMLKEGWTFAGVATIPEVKLMQKRRYCRAWRKVTAKLDQLEL